MRKNKKLLFILIPGALLLWGIIIYKIYSVVGGKQEDGPFVQNTFDTGSNNEISDTFSLHQNYRDPFLEGKIVKHTFNQNNSPSIKSTSKPDIITTTNTWPQIIYAGIIKNKKSNKQLILIQINGQTYSMKVGETNSNIQLTKVFKDSIEIKFRNEKRYIKK